MRLAYYSNLLIKCVELVSVYLLVFWSTGPSLPSGIDTLIRGSSYLFIAWLALRNIEKMSFAFTKDMALTSLIIVAVLSIYWSASPEFTFNDSKALVRSTIFGAYLAVRYSKEKMMHVLFAVFFVAMVSSLIASLVNPSYGVKFAGLWNGIYSHKENLGQLSVMSTLISINIFLSRKKTYPSILPIILIVISVIILLFTEAKTSLVLLIFNLLLLPLFNLFKRPARLRFIVLAFSAFTLLVAAILVFSNLEWIVVDLLGKDLAGNGRDIVWELSLEKAFQRPWLGYGYAGFWTSDEALYVINNSWGQTTITGELDEVRWHAHNGYIDLFLSLGWLGVVLYAISFANVFFKIISIASFDPRVENFWVIQYLITISLFSLFLRGTILDTNHLFWILYVYIALSSSVEYSTMLKYKRRAAILKNTSRELIAN